MRTVWGKWRWTQVLEVAVSIAAGAVGAALAFDLGMRVAGLWLGLIMGLNAGVFCLLTASFLTDRIFRRKPHQPGD